MNNHSIQAALFQAIKGKLSPAISLADEIAQVLRIGTDSAYRRIRGEKPLSIDELYHLSTHYQVSIDRLFNNNHGGFYFQGRLLSPEQFSFEKYLQGIVQQLQYVASFPESHMYYMCKDIPVFYHFQYRDLAAFKYFFWMRAIVNHPDFTHRTFSFSGYTDELFALGGQILSLYNRFPSTELWNVESINSTLQQISFCRDTGMFDSNEDLQRVYQSLEQLVQHLEAQAEEGMKWYASGSQRQGASYAQYQNEFILGDNSILAVTGPRKLAFIVHSVINFMITHDVSFCDHLYQNIQNLMKRSTLISTDSEQERNAFFRQLYRRIDQEKMTTVEGVQQ